MRTCARCGRRYERGEGSTYLDTIHPDNSVSCERIDLCHPDDPSLPDCYHLVTVYHVPLSAAPSPASPHLVGPDQDSKEDVK